MPSGPVFHGFPNETLNFYRGLAVHNDKPWFDAHKDDFERDVMDPARAFVYDMGKRLKAFVPGINADPRVNRSLFRIHRDTRFSKDKTPYKTHLAMWFWEGAGPRMECPGFYVHIEPEMLVVGAGLYLFPKPILDAYREAVIHPKHGAGLAKIVAAIEGKRGYAVYGKEYKKVPRGYDPKHPRAELLLYSGLAPYTEMVPPPVIHTAKLIDFCLERFRVMLPVHAWMVEMIGRM
jgi:uncharacterized protein (TIGR02453 family)